jgi:hypothetical protein
MRKRTSLFFLVSCLVISCTARAQVDQGRASLIARLQATLGSLKLDTNTDTLNGILTSGFALACAEKCVLTFTSAAYDGTFHYRVTVDDLSSITLFCSNFASSVMCKEGDLELSCRPGSKCIQVEDEGYVSRSNEDSDSRPRGTSTKSYVRLPSKTHVAASVLDLLRDLVLTYAPDVRQPEAGEPTRAETIAFLQRQNRDGILRQTLECTPRCTLDWNNKGELGQPQNVRLSALEYPVFLRVSGDSGTIRLTCPANHTCIWYTNANREDGLILGSFRPSIEILAKGTDSQPKAPRKTADALSHLIWLDGGAARPKDPF